MSRYDDIVEVNKSDTDELVEVEKFNPFHDAIGRFSSSRGMKTYSANPKTKAGAMAIGRSAAAGYGFTMNIHRESKGENIAQNDRWIRTGQKPKIPAAQSSLLSRAAANGVRSTPSTSSNQQAQQKPTKQQKPAAQKPTQQPKGNTLADSVANVKYTSNDKLALQARNRRMQTVSTKKVADDHDQARVAGKDISKTFDYSKMKSGKDPIDAIAEAQGWNKASTVTNDRDLFNKAALKSGRVMMRSVDGYGNKNADKVCNDTMTNGNSSLGGNGMKAYGTGMYLVDTNIKGSSGRTMAKKVSAGQEESGWYGNKQMMATVHPDAKIATPTQAAKLSNDFARLSSADRRRFGNDRNTYIASKGYDGVKWHSDSDPRAYSTLFNKSALIFYGGVADTN